MTFCNGDWFITTRTHAGIEKDMVGQIIEASTGYEGVYRVRLEDGWEGNLLADDFKPYGTPEFFTLKQKYIGHAEYYEGAAETLKILEHDNELATRMRSNAIIIRGILAEVEVALKKDGVL